MALRRLVCLILIGKFLFPPPFPPPLSSALLTPLPTRSSHGIGRVMEMALAHIGNDTPIHLSFDVDALDPMWAPSTGTPVRGGLTLREGDYIAECVHETGNLVAMDLVEVNPQLVSGDSDPGASETVRAGCSLVRCALGESLL